MVNLYGRKEGSAYGVIRIRPRYPDSTEIPESGQIRILNQAFNNLTCLLKVVWEGTFLIEGFLSDALDSKRVGFNLQSKILKSSGIYIL